MADQEAGRRANRLIEETSPYLLQHAYNPVDWYPWGEEALQRAHSEDKPILLSIGYAACHWCHVMERESFEDPEIAQLMNASFICIKVDREERPDIDAIYMDAVQAMTGHGGWPMTMFLTPEGHPFYGGTYFPPADRHGMPAFRRVLEAITEAWKERRDEAVQQGRKLVDAIAAQAPPRPAKGQLDPDLLTSATESATRGFDSRFGGFGRAPKFPQAPLLEFLLRMAIADEKVRGMLELTLDSMARGGIYDQLGGGFARYSVDDEWLVPHFEKMLYDNAQLARVYTHAWQLTKRPLYKRIATETLEYLMRDMLDESGAFHSSEDADSEGEEGKFYVWSHDEFIAVAPEAADYYGVTTKGNFEGHNILTASGDDPPQEARSKLLEARAPRTRPGRDDKILTSWNGLAISAFAEAGVAFSSKQFVDAARTTAAMLLEKSVTPEGRLLHSYKNGVAKILGMLEDYAYLSDGLLTLYEATLEPRWFESAKALVDQGLALFWDDNEGGLFSTGSDHERLIVRQKEVVESATPSPAGTMALQLLRLSVITGDNEMRSKAESVVRASHAYMQRAPQAVPTFLSALDFMLGDVKEIVLVGSRSAKEVAALADEVWTRFIPNKVVVASPPGIDSPLLQGREALNGAATAFVCRGYVCDLPVTNATSLAAQLDS